MIAPIRRRDASDVQRSPAKPTKRGVRLPVLPTLLTLGNGICGLASISYAASAIRGSGDDPALFYAGMFIFGAMVFDSLDGAVARWTKQTTRFGAELDSLCDAISFGVAPALIVLQISSAWPPRLLWVMAALFMACTVLRLARFNVETGEDDHGSFSGLPSPAAAATIASFVLIASNHVSPLLPQSARHLLLVEWGLPGLLRDIVPLVAVALAVLMVSRVRYPHIVHQALHGKQHFRQLAQIVFAIAAIVALGELAAPMILCAFVLSSPARATWERCLGLPWSPLEARDSSEDATAEIEPRRRPRLRLWWPPRGKRRRRA
jgi:CDP-diacylglycerol---serine O-phosphatidyltransferase